MVLASDLENFCSLLFEASNEDRLKILELLRGEPMSVTKLSKVLSIGTQEMSRHVSRLIGAGLVERDVDGLNHISNYGGLTLIQLAGVRFTAKNSRYFADHPLDRLPTQFVLSLGELEESTFLDDTILVFDHVEKMISEAEEYVYRITDRYLRSWLPIIDDALRHGVEYRMLSPADIVVPSNFKMPPLMTKADIRGQFNVRTTPGPHVFLAMSEKEVSALGFLNSKGRLDYFSFQSRDPRFHGWCLDLFNNYWAASKPAPRERLLNWGTFEEKT